MKKVIIAVLALAVLGGGAFALSQNKDEDAGNNSVKNESTTRSQSSQSSGSSETSVTTTNGQSEVTITYTNDGFSANNIEVMSGARITIKNTSSRTLDFASDEHPTHELNSELNVGDIAPGDSKTFTVNRKGTFGFHNHLNPGDSGSITVN